MSALSARSLGSTIRDWCLAESYFKTRFINLQLLAALQVIAVTLLNEAKASPKFGEDNASPFIMLNLYTSFSTTLYRRLPQQSSILIILIQRSPLSRASSFKANQLQVGRRSDVAMVE